ncbi:hypothetical protein NQZ68_005788 [Dissostichus eleginoides]|nr:hypothetical protein NQZ68_005788 [Dissostichus eleginoides]
MALEAAQQRSSAGCSTQRLWLWLWMEPEEHQTGAQCSPLITNWGTKSEGLGQTAGGAEEKPGHGIYKSVALRLLYQTSMEEQQTPQLKNSGVTAIASLAEAR